LFLVPGSGTTLRINGRAHVTTDTALCASFTVEGKAARSVTVIDIDSVYFQCARAIVRSELWNAARHVDPKSLPTPGQILEITSRRNIDGETYDKEWPERAKKTMW
ncbi:pyridoxamine 5'-phosphate oxidase family protein, partial [Mesorhizobium sp. M7A.F.Ca.CA.004.11.2.1]